MIHHNYIEIRGFANNLVIGIREEFQYLMQLEEEFNADLVDRIFAQLKSLDVDWGGYSINRYQHSLQSATRAFNDGADEEMVVAALLPMTSSPALSVTASMNPRIDPTSTV